MKFPKLESVNDSESLRVLNEPTVQTAMWKATKSQLAWDLALTIDSRFIAPMLAEAVKGLRAMLKAVLHRLA